jgi:hypothetical protein
MIVGDVSLVPALSVIACMNMDTQRMFKRSLVVSSL